MAKGFIKQDGNRSLEDIAKGYLMYLIDINLVIAADRRKFDGVVKACKVHDLVRELCLRKAKEEHFNILQTERLILSSQFSSFITPPHKPVRMFMNNNIDILEFAHPSTQNLRSILCFSDFRSLSDDIAKYFRSFGLLRVLDLRKCRLNDLPKGMELLVHLRYFVIWSSSAVFPSSICNLWCLQTLIYITSNFRVPLPSKITDLVNLRHLWSFNLGGERVFFFLPSIEKPMNLQTISGVVFGDGVENFQNYFPCIKELTCPNYVDDFKFKSLTYLEKLKLIGFPRRRISTVHDSPKVFVKNRITFPATLKTLTLVDCRLPWRDMSIIQSIPNLQVLKLHKRAFEGSWWNTDGQKFPQLKFLRLEKLDIKLWETCSTSFLCLRQLEIIECGNLEEIPLEIGDIPTLDLIQIKRCRGSVGDSVRRIEEEQHDLGNYDLKINVSDTSYLY
ncbi:putative leucine-rich repeat domain superfamily [Helianthus debilis subsp. tardiflorus]